MKLVHYLELGCVFTTGKYIQMMRLLKPIAFAVMTCMAQLFDFYMFSVSTIHFSVDLFSFSVLSYWDHILSVVRDQQLPY